MIKKIFTVYDAKAESYGPIFVHRNRWEALRAFSDASNSNSQESLLAKHPDDFTLFEVGTYNEETGEIAATAAKTALGTARDVQNGLKPEAAQLRAAE